MEIQTLGRRALLVLALVPLMACSSISNGASDMVSGLQKSMRAPGHNLSDFPEKVAEQYECSRQRLPYFQLEENELLPIELHSGGELNHRMVYALCADKPSGIVRGRLSTRIHYKGEPIVSDTIDDFEIQPGRWVVDSFVALPETAPPGIYAYQVEFVGKGVRFNESLSFYVRE